MYGPERLPVSSRFVIRKWGKRKEENEYSEYGRTRILRHTDDNVRVACHAKCMHGACMRGGFPSTPNYVIVTRGRCKTQRR